MNYLLSDTSFWAFVGLILFFIVVAYFKVPGIMLRSLDSRADEIRDELAEAKRLREEAQEIYASYERRQREVSGQADQIIANAKREAEAQAAKAKEDLKISIERRLKAAEEQIASAESDAVRAVRDRAVRTAVAAASELLAQQVAAGQRSAGIDDAIEDVARRLN